MDGYTSRTSRKNASVSIPLNNNVFLDATEKKRSVGINNSRMNWNSNYLGPSVDFKMMSRARIKSDDVMLKEEMKKSRSAENFDTNFPVLGSVATKQAECGKVVSRSPSQSTIQKPSSFWANSPASLLASPTPCDSLVAEAAPELETLKTLIPKTSVAKLKSKPLKYSASLNGINNGVRRSPVRMEPSNVKTKSVSKSPVNIAPNVATTKPPIKPALPNFQSIKPTLEIVTKLEIEKDIDPYFDSDPAWDEDGSEGASTSMSGSTILGSLDGYNNQRTEEVLDSWDDYEGEDMTVIEDSVSTSPFLKEGSPIRSTTEPIKCQKLEPYTALFKYSKSMEKEEEFLQRLGWNKDMYYAENVNENEFVISQEEVEEFFKSVGKV